jgi:hypothetical protein
MLPTNYQRYTYIHRDPITNIVRYVGAGSKGRAWACGWSSKGGPKRGNRTKDHQKWLDSLFDMGYTMGDIVEIIQQGLTKVEAHILEQKLFKQYNSVNLFNIFSKPSLLKLEEKEIKSAQKLREQGKSYKDISCNIGVSTMTIYRALNNKTKGYSLNV